MTKPKTPASASRARQTAQAVAGLLDGTYPNVYQACKVTRASPDTVSRHLQGGRTRHQANLENMYLTLTEESALVDFAQRAAAVGHPIRHSYLRELAETPHRSRVGSTAALPVGKLWAGRFLKRHPILKSQIAKTIEQARIEVTKEQVLEWFRQYKQEIDTHKIVPENIYNMDESGTNTHDGS